MNLELRFFATVQEVIGTETMTREFEPGTTVEDVLDGLEAEYPDLKAVLRNEDGDFAHHITILRNGEQVTNLDGFDTELADGDEIAITPPRTGP
ncbi:MoaD family protein [Natronococcus sp. A-GB1]|uniref:ubiquitin-like small modifier protein 1 n=1 Tax=Natronococcus sp. A-GB1 TaxID=3037648 RepID=UPI00241F6C45|nr:ubiquitin-like small modifier protein 1 [Natronococcus sp. A-GB1]MDG5761670.1 MoaD family protein [Natronococcus sp. A-GB1]